MSRRLACSLSIGWRVILVLLTLFVAAVSVLRYFTHGLEAPSVVTDNLFANPFLVLHVAGGVTALLLGPIQFVRAIRSRFPAVHRSTGYVYAGACAIGAPAGLILAIGTTAGPIAGSGFAVLAILWPLFTFLGICSAIARDFVQHRSWMLRSYAMAGSAITLRLMLPIAGLMGIAFLPAYQIIAWICWITNLAIVEIYLRRGRRPALPEARLATA